MNFRSGLLVAALGLLCGLPARPVLAADWLPINADELSMTSEPLAPGAPAIYLYRQVDRDDNNDTERVYERVKILTEAGRDRGNIEIRYDKRREAVAFIQARTIRPDGTISVFNGSIDDKPIVSLGREKLNAKTFTLPQVTVGSIVELRYLRELDPLTIYDSRWLLSADLFTRSAKFSMHPYSEFTVTYSWPRGLPNGAAPPAKDRDGTTMTVQNVPAFVTEEFMPPENEMKYRVDFRYESDTYATKDTADFWKHQGKALNHDAEHFMDQRRAMTRAVAEIIAPADDADSKLRKIYARVQQVHNLGYEGELTDQERAKFKKNDDVEDVWNHGYGDPNQLTLLYAALLRAAGFQPAVVYVAPRSEFLFDPRVENKYQLTSYVVIVNSGDHDLYLDPGVPFTGFGLLPWFEASSPGLRLDENGGTWVTTPTPTAFASQIQRKAELQLEEDGTLSGTLRVTYTGLEASKRRISEHLEDRTSRTTYLEDEVRNSVTVGIDVSLTNQPDWDSAEQPLVADFKLRIPGWAQPAGHRLLLPMGIFNAVDRHTFEHADRVQPLYFPYRNARVDDVSISLPNRYQSSTLPAPHDSNLSTMAYHIGADQDGNVVEVKRSLIENALVMQTSSYPAVRDFFLAVRNGDEQQLVLSADTNAAHH